MHFIKYHGYIEIGCRQQPDFFETSGSHWWINTAGLTGLIPWCSLEPSYVALLPVERRLLMRPPHPALPHFAPLELDRLHHRCLFSLV